LVIDETLIKGLEAYGDSEIPTTGANIDLPRLVILQALSPQLKKGGDQYLSGAEIGDFCLVGPDIGEVYKTGVVAIPCDVRIHHVHWAKERGHGGPVRNYFEDDSVLSQCKKVGQNYFLPNGDEVVQTATWFCLVTEIDDTRPLSEAGWLEVYLPLKHAGWTEHKGWKRLIESEEPIPVSGGGMWKPTAKFWRTWFLAPASRSNRRRQDWEAFKPERGPTLLEIDPSGGLMELAKRFAAERIAEAMRYKLDPQDKRSMIEGSLAEPRV
jgi:hypothetical protein